MNRSGFTSVTNIPSSSGSSRFTRFPSTPPLIRIPSGSPVARVNVTSWKNRIDEKKIEH